jgi:methionyl-tRNA synthetase
MADPATEQYHFIGKDITTFHTLFWPALAALQRPQDAQFGLRARFSDHQCGKNEQKPRHRP